jgi:hypothetical protein
MIDDRAGLLRVVRPGRSLAIARQDRLTPIRRSAPALVRAVILLITAALLIGCGATTTSASSAFIAATGPGTTTAAANTPAVIAAPTAPAAVDGRHGRPAAGATTPSLPADWPSDLPVPHGTLTGATGSNGRWTAQYLVLGSAADVLKSTADLFHAAGFTSVSDSVLSKGNLQLTLVVENRDHSAGETTLVIQVSTT